MKASDFSIFQGWEVPTTILAIFGSYVEGFSPGGSVFLEGLKKLLSLER